MIITTRQQRRALASENRRWPTTMVQVPKSDWPSASPDRDEVWRSRDFLAQVFKPENGAVRVSINRTEIDGPRWKAEISWDELQRIKREIGRGEAWAVEIFPADSSTVNVANMRHLWLLNTPPEFAWK